MTETALEGCRVLDLTDDRGALCSKIFGDLSADVIKIEPPHGDPSHNIAPFYNNTPHPENSIYWFSLNTNKRGITLDLKKAEGQELFKSLVKTANIVVESFEVGYLKGLGLDYHELRGIKPDIIMTSLLPSSPG